MSLGASQTTGEVVAPLLNRALIPQSSGIPYGAVLSHVTVAGDDRWVDLPNVANAIAGGRAFAGLCAADGPTVVPQDNSFTVIKLGIGKARLKIGATCVAGGDCGYDPADAGVVQPVTTTNAGLLVVIGRFTQNKSASSSVQLVGVELHANGVSAERSLGAIVASSTAVSNTTSETAFDQVIPIPAGRILAAGTVLKIRAKARATSTPNDTLILRARLDSPAGVLLGQTPAVSIRTAGDLGILDLTATIRTVGASGTLVAEGTGGISPGQTVATGGNVQVTGTAGTLAIDTTVAHNIVITAQWGAASTNDSVVLENLVATIS